MKGLRPRVVCVTAEYFFAGTADKALKKVGIQRSWDLKVETYGQGKCKGKIETNEEKHIRQLTLLSRPVMAL